MSIVTPPSRQFLLTAVFPFRLSFSEPTITESRPHPPVGATWDTIDLLQIAVALNGLERLWEGVRFRGLLSAV